MLCTVPVLYHPCAHAFPLFVAYVQVALARDRLKQEGTDKAGELGVKKEEDSTGVVGKFGCALALLLSCALIICIHRTFNTVACLHS
jgi:hypothetical protein